MRLRWYDYIIAIIQTVYCICRYGLDGAQKRSDEALIKFYSLHPNDVAKLEKEQKRTLLSIKTTLSKMG